MQIEQRLQLTIGFIKQNPASTSEQLISFLVSQGDTLEEAQAAIPLYLGMMVQFGYIDTPTYEAMRDWGNSRTIEQITIATTAMLKAYNEQKAKEDKLNELLAEKARLEADATELEVPLTPEQIDNLVQAEQQHRFDTAMAFRERITQIDDQIATYGN